MLRAGTTGFVIGCRVPQLTGPVFGSLVRVPLDQDYQVYGLIYDIHIDDDGLVRQLVTAESVDENIIQDNRLNRNVPVEMSVLTVGYDFNGKIYHLLPPRPPLSLDVIYLCDEREIRQFTSSGRFGYFRHILRSPDLPIGEIFAAHLQQANQAHAEEADINWVTRAVRELIILLRDDYATLMTVLSALSDAIPDAWVGSEG
jgi:hypothetical protein